MSLLSTYNNLKVLLVNKLQSKGITTANTSQGMTTLIGKIDDIEDTFSTTIDGEDISGVYPPNVNVPISSSLKLVYENDDEVSVSAPLENADVTYTFVGANNYYTNTVTTDTNGVASMNFNTSEKDTYTVLVNFLESRPFQAVSDFVLCTLTIFESIIKYFQNISFSNSDGTNSRELSYGNNQSVTMTVQSFEEDNITPSKGSQVDYLIGTSIDEESYEDITLTTDVEYDLTGYDFDILFDYDYQDVGQGLNVLEIDDITNLADSSDMVDGVNIYQQGVLKGRWRNPFFRIIGNEVYLIDRDTLEIEEYLTDINNLNVTAHVQGFSIRKYIDNDDFEIVDTVLNNIQGLSSYEYEAQGVGEIYIKAQSHDDPTIQTDPYLISDWVKKDFTGVGDWIAFTGRVNTFSSNTDTVFTQSNGSKGGVHSQNTVFHLPNDDYIVSFKVNNGTIGTGVRVGLHSASYDDHHEKAVIGIENDSSGGFKFDYSTSEVTTVTKVLTNLTQLNTDDLIEFRVVDNTVTFHINGTQYASATLDWLHTPIWLYGQSWSTNNGNFSINEFRVKRIIGEE